MSKNRYSLDSLKSVLEKELGHELSEANLTMLKLAYRAHSSQYRESVKKDQKIPFIVHPVGVAALIIKHFPLVEKYLKDDLDTLITATLAHDLLEDTRVTRVQIEAIGGDRVVRLVDAMTKLPNPSHIDFARRNKETISRTLAAGASAVYIRSCDSMHNLSWPKLTPNKLLTRGIARAHNVYMPLLDKVKIGTELKKLFISKIKEVEEYLKNEPAAAAESEIPKTIEQAIEQCAFFTHKKILEIHDIVEILQRITGADNISAWSPHGTTEGIFIPAVSEGKEKKFNESLKETQLDFITQELSSDKVRNFLPHHSQSGRYFILNLPISSSYRHMILLIFEHNKMPEWGSVINFEFLIDSLAERLIIANADYRKTLVSVASQLGMRFEESWADKLSIEAAHLTELQQWQKLCLQAIRQVTHICEIFFEQEARQYPLKDLVRIESRVKEAPSIIRKFLPPSSFEWPKFDQIGDIAGIRVICPTKKLVASLKRYLSSSEIHHLGISIHPKYSMKDYTKNPTLKGYRAIHLVLSVDTYLNKKKIKVPCEVQLQTMIQDVWAKIAHRVTYKKEDHSDNIHRQLREIGKNLNNFDALVESITGSDKK